MSTCSNREVTETNCDGSQGGRGPSTVKEGVVTLKDVTGKLSIRKANPAQCAHIMWGLFEPSGASKGAFKVTAQVGDVVADQPSEPGKDIESAWTEGVYVPVGTDIRACVVIGDQHMCVATTSV